MMTSPTPPVDWTCCEPEFEVIEPGAVWGVGHAPTCPHRGSDELAIGTVELDPRTGITRWQARELLDGMESRMQSALAIYRVYRDARDLDTIRIVSYRCRARRCLLLDVFRTPVGPAAFIPMHRLSPEANATSSHNARVTRTLDGVRRWVERADLLMQPPLEYRLNCEHVHNQVLPASDVQALLDNPPPGPVLI